MQSLTEKQAKEMRESRMGRNTFLDNLNDRFGSPFISISLGYKGYLVLKHAYLV